MIEKHTSDAAAVLRKLQRERVNEVHHRGAIEDGHIVGGRSAAAGETELRADAVRVDEEHFAAEAAHQEAPPRVERRLLTLPHLRHHPLLFKRRRGEHGVVDIPSRRVLVGVHQPRAFARREERTHCDIRAARFASEDR